MYIAKISNFNWMFAVDPSLMSDSSEPRTKLWEKVAEELNSFDSSLLEDVADNPFDVIEVDVYPAEELGKEKPVYSAAAFFYYKNPSYILIGSAKQMYEHIMDTLSDGPFVSKEDAIHNLAQAVQYVRIFK